MSTVYRKTDKGRREVETRAAGLSLRLRSLLIMVDGQRDADSLRSLVPRDLDAGLQALVADDFIETRHASDQVTQPTQAFDHRKRMAVRFLTDRLGPPAETLAVRIESAESPADLVPALERAEAVLRQTTGSSAGNMFRALFIEPSLP